MAEMYEIIDALLAERGISGTQMSQDLGMSRSFMTELRKGRARSIKLETAQKIAEYFQVSLDYLTGDTSEKEPLRSSGRYMNDEDIKFALFGGEGDISDAMLQEVKDFARFLTLREQSKEKS